MSVLSAALGATGSARFKRTTTATWSASFDYYDLTTGNTDVTFTFDSTTIIQNRSYLIRKADAGLGWIIIVDESANVLQRIYKQFNYCSIMYDGTNFIIL